jgi:RimJ/RimL family protein N-acetyltransferase
MDGTPPAYRILTRRLILRCWEPTDAPELKRVVDANIEHLLPFMPWAAHEPTPLEDKIARVRRWAHTDIQASKAYVFIGCCAKSCRFLANLENPPAETLVGTIVSIAMPA